MERCVSVSLIVATLVCCVAGLIKVDPKTQFFVDEYGRSRIFHGVNTVYKGPPFHPPVLDRFDANNSLADIDFENLRGWGFNVIRLHVGWEGVEPQRGEYNYNYLNVIKNITQRAEKYGIHVMLDAHQDLFNPQFCGNGMPDWAAITDSKGTFYNFPFPLLYKIERDKNGYPLRSSCTKHAFFQYYLTMDVAKAFHNFFTNVNGTRTSFAKMWSVVAAHFKNNANVLGWDILNEPWAGQIFKDPTLLTSKGKADRVNLIPLYKEIHNAIRAVDTERILFYEPTVCDLDVIGFESGPGGREFDDRQALSYHVYCSINDQHGDPRSRAICNWEDNLFFRWRGANTKRIGGGAFLSEFGAVSNSPKAIDELHYVLSNADKLLHSWAYWQFKYYNDFTTAAMPGNLESFYDVHGNLYREKVRALSRTYPQATCGTPTSMHFDPLTAQFDLVYTAKNCSSHPTEIYLNEAWYYTPSGYKVTVAPADAATVTKPAVNYVHVTHTSKVQPGDTITVKITRA